MTDKIIISRKEIEKLQKLSPNSDGTMLLGGEDAYPRYIDLNDLRALLDKAEVVSGEPVAQVAQEGFGRGQVYWHKKCPPDGTDLYTTPGQSAKIAELEAEIARLKDITLMLLKSPS